MEKNKIDINDAEHPYRQVAIHIIEEIVEPLMFTMASNIRYHSKKTKEDIVKELLRGMEGEAYYKMEDEITNLIDRIIK